MLLFILKRKRSAASPQRYRGGLDNIFRGLEAFLWPEPGPMDAPPFHTGRHPVPQERPMDHFWWHFGRPGPLQGRLWAPKWPLRDHFWPQWLTLGTTFVAYGGRGGRSVWFWQRLTESSRSLRRLLELLWVSSTLNKPWVTGVSRLPGDWLCFGLLGGSFWDHFGSQNGPKIDDFW